MSEDKQRILNLDDLFGQGRPVKVTWQGATYELARPEAFTPVQYQQFMKLQSDYILKKFDQTTDPVLIDEIMDEILDMLNPKIAKAGISFGGKVKVLEFYSEEVGGSEIKNASSPREAPAKSSTGA